MEFEFLIPEDAQLRAHIFQRSNLKYVKTVMDHIDERQHEDFRNSPLGYLADIPDIQFSAQLILQLLFRTIRTEKIWKKIRKGQEEEGERDYMHGSRLPHHHTSLGVRGDSGLGNALFSESVNDYHEFFAGPLESSHNIVHTMHFSRMYMYNFDMSLFPLYHLVTIWYILM
ncbi:Hypothetical predicted protein [Olea europaea subsp. europaea]|uniref:Uncharacterized protein n=1 Tax=Olea europaea subsp. europaea TaxID=158383 RepID=A0A8S0TDZ1_OLEEU|nr:Hypothetical predicted protein [Olea europaea subsp. europaea]